MTEFANVVERWETFYFAMAGVSGTLLGLLFVGVSLSVVVIGHEQYADLRSIANQAYINYLYLLLVSLAFLIPDLTATGLGISLLLLSTAGLIGTIQQIRATHQHRQHPLRQAYIRWPVLMPIISLMSLIAFVMLLGVGALLLAAQSLSFDLLVIPLLLLTVAAAQTTWDFLAKRGSVGEVNPKSEPPG
jgi:hypothetical protein